MEVGVPEVYLGDPLPLSEGCPDGFWCLHLNFSALRKRFSLLRSSKRLHLLQGFGTKNSRLKTPDMFDFVLVLWRFVYKLM